MCVSSRRYWGVFTLKPIRDSGLLDVQPGGDLI
jgi:hypothetical protein